jgi:hypothetical protein
LTFNEFKQGLTEGKLPGLKCLDCGQVIAPPSAVCTSCGSVKLEVGSFPPKGWIRTFTVVRVAPGGFQAPYVVALVELQDGPWVLGNVINIEPESVSMDIIGKSVSVGHKLFPPETPDGGIEGVALTFELDS